MFEWLERNNLIDTPRKVPERVAGLESSRITALTETLSSVADRLIRVSVLMRIHEQSLALLSLTSLLQLRKSKGKQLDITDVAPYRRDIKELNIYIGCLNYTLGCLLFLVPPILLIAKKVTNKWIDKKVVKELLRENIDNKLNEYIGKVKPLVEYLGSIANPREEFMQEISRLYFKIQKDVNSGMNADTALYSTLWNISMLWSVQRREYPLISNMISTAISISRISGIGDKISQGREKIIVASPEIFRAIESLISNEISGDILLSEVEVSHPKRQMAEFLFPEKLTNVQRLIGRIFCNIRDLLPEDGKEFKKDYDTFINSIV